MPSMPAIRIPGRGKQTDEKTVNENYSKQETEASVSNGGVEEGVKSNDLDKQENADGEIDFRSPEGVSENDGSYEANEVPKKGTISHSDEEPKGDEMPRE